MRFDPGLQPERTALSWSRISLSVVVAGAAGLKVLPGLAGTGGWAMAAGVIAAGGSLGIVARRRVERGLVVLLSGEGRLPDGRLLLGVAGLVSLVAAVAIVTVACAQVVR